MNKAFLDDLKRETELDYRGVDLTEQLASLRMQLYVASKLWSIEQLLMSIEQLLMHQDDRFRGR